MANLLGWWSAKPPSHQSSSVHALLRVSACHSAAPVKTLSQERLLGWQADHIILSQNVSLVKAERPQIPQDSPISRALCCPYVTCTRCMSKVENPFLDPKKTETNGVVLPESAGPWTPRILNQHKPMIGPQNEQEKVEFEQRKWLSTSKNHSNYCPPRTDFERLGVNQSIRGMGL